MCQSDQNLSVRPLLCGWLLLQQLLHRVLHGLQLERDGRDLLCSEECGGQRHMCDQLQERQSIHERLQWQR